MTETQGSETEDGQNGSQFRPLSGLLTLHLLYLKSRLYLAVIMNSHLTSCSPEALNEFRGMDFRKAAPCWCLGSPLPWESTWCISLFVEEWQCFHVSFVCVCVIICLTGWHILFVFSNTDFLEGSEVKIQNTEICFS